MHGAFAAEPEKGMEMRLISAATKYAGATSVSIFRSAPSSGRGLDTSLRYTKI
jgi:hypothetical protein